MPFFRGFHSMSADCLERSPLSSAYRSITAAILSPRTGWPKQAVAGTLSLLRAEVAVLVCDLVLDSLDSSEIRLKSCSFLVF